MVKFYFSARVVSIFLILRKEWGTTDFGMEKWPDFLNKVTSVANLMGQEVYFEAATSVWLSTLGKVSGT